MDPVDESDNAEITHKLEAPNLTERCLKLAHSKCSRTLWYLDMYEFLLHSLRLYKDMTLFIEGCK